MYHVNTVRSLAFYIYDFFMYIPVETKTTVVSSDSTAKSTCDKRHMRQNAHATKSTLFESATKGTHDNMHIG